MVEADQMATARRILLQFGQELRRVREDVGLSLRELDEEIGIRYSDLSRIEAGRLCPSDEQLRILNEWVLQHPTANGG